MSIEDLAGILAMVYTRASWLAEPNGPVSSDDRSRYQHEAGIAAVDAVGRIFASNPAWLDGMAEGFRQIREAQDGQE